MEELDAYRQALMNALITVVNELAVIVAAIPARSWHLESGSDSHTPHYLLAQLHALESQVFAVQPHRFLDDNEVILSTFDAKAWLAGHYDPEASPRSIMDDLAALRRVELDWLRDLSSESWSRTARHPWWGVHTLQWWVELQLKYSDQLLGELSRLCGM
jgi:hypothetical protein